MAARGDSPAVARTARDQLREQAAQLGRREAVLNVAELSRVEAEEMGPLLRRAWGCVRELSRADQVYVCLWSHAGWEPVHIHFVVQPSWGHQREKYSAPGPSLQSEMFVEGLALPRVEVEALCDDARSWFARND